MNKFNLGENVILTMTQDNVMGKVVGVYRSVKDMYNQMQAKSLLDSWHTVSHIPKEEIIKQPIYAIKFNPPVLPGPESIAREKYREEFLDEESFLRWLEKQKTHMLSTFEQDLMPASSIVPDMLPEGI